MAYDPKTQRLISLKKLAGKAQTSNDKDLANEGLPSGVTVTSETVFGETITASPSSTSLYTITGKVEYLRFPASFIAGSDTTNGRHGFELKLPPDYEANSSNGKKGTYPFINGQSLNITSGSLQLVPTSFATSYEGKPFSGGTQTKGSGTQIPILDARDWYLDYFNGVYFQQDPPGTGDHSENPDYLEAFLYIGDMLNVVVAAGGGGGGTGDGDPNAQYLVLSATGSLSAERVLNPQTGLIAVDSGAGNNYSISLDNSVAATLTGSQFSGNVGITGSFGTESTALFNLGLSGSLTQLTDGTSYLKAGSNITVASASNGAITITGTGAGEARKKDAYFMSSETVAGSSVSVSSSDFSTGNYNMNKIDIFLNGQLLHSGSLTQVSAAERDYYIDSASSLKFSFDVRIDDILDVVVFAISS
jgi:hypothetical protein|tara:strand:+ start:2708 stop:3961 length:1254 start_codon:yes stop_codon:yes gene_type:complete